MNGRNLSRRSARRRARTRTALFLCLFGAVGMALLAVLASLIGAAWRPWLSMAGALVFYALPAYLGLYELDGDQTHLLMKNKLSSAQTMWFALCGVLLVGPSLLLSGVMEALVKSFGAAPAQAAGSADASLLMPLLLGSAVIAPACEEVFFRGYLLGVFARVGRGRAAVLTALLFALAHGAGLEMLSLFGMGLLFAAAAYRAQSLIAPVIMHMAYNAAIVLLAVCGAGPLFSIGNPFSALLLLAVCAGFVCAISRAWRAQGVFEQVQLPHGKMNWRALWPLLLAVLLAIAAQLTPGALQAMADWQAQREAQAALAGLQAALGVMEVLV